MPEDGGTDRSAGRPRAVVEHPNSIVRLDLAEDLAAAGWSVSTCQGPAKAVDGCPLLGGHECRLIDAADLVVNGLREHQGDIARAVREAHPEVDIVVLCDEAAWTELDAAVPGLVRGPDVPSTDAVAAYRDDADTGASGATGRPSGRSS